MTESPMPIKQFNLASTEEFATTADLAIGFQQLYVKSSVSKLWDFVISYLAIVE
jgi:hypothetical protein